VSSPSGRSPLGAGGGVKRLVFVLALACGCELYEGRSLEFFATGASTQCRVDTECSGQLPWCVAGQCTECVDARHCSGPKPACVQGTCVQCAASSDCSAASTCNQSTNECTLRCEEASQCAGQLESRCETSLGYCVQCAEDAHCTASNKPACDIAPGLCVECLADGHCQVPDPRCDSTSLKCVECLADSDCDTLHCDLAERRCTECLVDAHCPAGATCDDRRRCELPCRSDVDCDPKHPRCSPATGACVRCSTGADCTDPKKPVCSDDGECVECEGDSQCVQSDKPACVTARHRCAECTRPEHCAEGETCELESTRCRPGAG
jgi:Cys-rich repeat protein